MSTETLKRSEIKRYYMVTLQATKKEVFLFFTTVIFELIILF